MQEQRGAARTALDVGDTSLRQFRITARGTECGDVHGLHRRCGCGALLPCCERASAGCARCQTEELPALHRCSFAVSAMAKVSQSTSRRARTNGRKQTRVDDFRHMPREWREHIIAT